MYVNQPMTSPPDQPTIERLVEVYEEGMLAAGHIRLDHIKDDVMALAHQSAYAPWSYECMTFCNAMWSGIAARLNNQLDALRRSQASHKPSTTPSNN